MTALTARAIPANSWRIVLVALAGFVAATAIAGGVMLATGGEGTRFPPALLTSTPFSDYFVPGLLLALVVGGSALVATLACLRDARFGARASVLSGLVLMGWIAGEVLLLPSPETRSWVEAAYFGIGLLAATLGHYATKVAIP